MLLVDKRAGSKDLIAPLRKILGADKVDEVMLDFGDLAFAGKGANDTTLDIGVEFKTLGDIVQCCRDGRFAGHQLPGLRKTYDYSWLVIEGQWRHNDAGLIWHYVEHKHRSGGVWKPLPGKMRASEFEKHLLTFQLCGGVLVHTCNTRADSTRFICNLYRWWTDRALDAHSSHLAVHEPAAFGAVSDFRRAVMAWPHVGLKLSKTLEQFVAAGGRRDSLVFMASQPVETWANLTTDGRRFGEKNAQKVVNFLRGI